MQAKLKTPVAAAMLDHTAPLNIFDAIELQPGVSIIEEGKKKEGNMAALPKRMTRAQYESIQTTQTARELFEDVFTKEPPPTTQRSSTPKPKVLVSDLDTFNLSLMDK